MYKYDSNIKNEILQIADIFLIYSEDNFYVNDRSCRERCTEMAFT